jgi:hypothetical protein
MLCSGDHHQSWTYLATSGVPSSKVA